MAVEDRFQAAQTAISVQTQNQLARLWRDIDFSNLDAWFRENQRALVGAVRRGQIDAAVLAEAYIFMHAAENGVATLQTASIAAAAFAEGDAPDSRLTRVLQGSVIAAKWRIAEGASREDALKTGASRLFGVADMIVRDSAREAASAQMILEPGCVGYERKANLPACGRCLILAGKFFKNNQGFARHPQDDCFHVPVWQTADGQRVGGASQHPEDLFSSMTEEQKYASLGKDAKLVIDGKIDLQSAVNMRMRAPKKLDRLHKANSPRALRETYGSNPQRFAEELHKNGYLA